MASRSRHRLAAVGIALLLCACGVPVRVTHGDPRDITRELARNVVTTGTPSLAAQNVLHRWNLTARYDDEPQEALAALHREVVEGRADGRELFALAELSFDHAEDSGDRAWYLAAAVYAYAFLFPGDGAAAPARLDPRVRVAADVYNRALTLGLAAPDGETVALRPGIYALPFGELEIGIPSEAFLWHGRALYHFVPVAELRVRGLRARYRRPGIGAPLAAKAWVDGEPNGADVYVPRRTRVPVTAFLRLDDARRQLARPRLSATLELHDGSEASTVAVDGGTFPLELEPTATLAWYLAESPVWSFELKGLFLGDLLRRERAELAFLRPYRRGRIPVVFVHGTASSPARWADMVNDLDADPVIRERYQFWFFFYSTGNPIAYSASRLRDVLTEAVRAADPDGTDAALREMVLVGHSQGGLLTKYAVIDPGDRLWRRFSDRPFDEVSFRPKTRRLLEAAFFPKPLPFVRRVVFIATPHHGSYVAALSVSRLLARFVRLPADVAEATTDFATGHSLRRGRSGVVSGFGAITGMIPGSAGIEALAAEPIMPAVRAHSIIAVRGDGPPEDGADGVVRYESAHLPGVDSEKVVRAGHSCQGERPVIAEVERILWLHAEEACAARGVACADEPPALDPRRLDVRGGGE